MDVYKPETLGGGRKGGCDSTTPCGGRSSKIRSFQLIVHYTYLPTYLPTYIHTYTHTYTGAVN